MTAHRYADDMRTVILGERPKELEAGGTGRVERGVPRPVDWPPT